MIGQRHLEKGNLHFLALNGERGSQLSLVGRISLFSNKLWTGYQTCFCHDSELHNWIKKNAIVRTGCHVPQIQSNSPPSRRLEMSNNPSYLIIENNNIKAFHKCGQPATLVTCWIFYLFLFLSSWSLFIRSPLYSLSLLLTGFVRGRIGQPGLQGRADSSSSTVYRPTVFCFVMITEKDQVIHHL